MLVYQSNPETGEYVGSREARRDPLEPDRYLKHEVTDTDVTNKYIPISSDILFLKRILPFDTSSLGIGSGLFSAKYQIHLNDIANLSTFSATGLVNYVHG